MPRDDGPGPDFGRRVASVVRRIPAGRVATYGQVAALAGRPGAARAVGRILRELPEGARLPWHRVVSAPGRIAPALLRAETGGEQAGLLRAEGVGVDGRGRLDLRRHAWRGGRLRLSPLP
jgi:methylated-DNA-protein-cysteine methyltransferase related protein